MDTYPDIQFINTGKGIPGISEQGYQSFEEQCKKSRHADRIHLLGWVSRTELDLLLNQATLGINIDLPIYETVFGARNRMNEYLAFGLPVCTTPGSQIANTLIEHAGALQVHSQNAKHLASQLI
ncbi:MAG: glycosyltransferase [Patescibacteria group bacterium]|nr:glycosyltransferase [Patescibacteria group bacterium]